MNPFYERPTELQHVKNAEITSAQDGSPKTNQGEAEKYGELILLGYNGSTESGRINGHGRRQVSKMVLNKRPMGNGIKKSSVSNVSVPPEQTKAVRDRTKHTVSYTYARNYTVVVEYATDTTKDMFQIGRSSENQIDFTVVDTWLAASASGALSSRGKSGEASERNQAGAERKVVDPPAEQVSSTISRYACRILVDRSPPHTARLYAAGFDQSRNIFLGEKATKWTKKKGEVDALTTNGILILHPGREGPPPTEQHISCIKDGTDHQAEQQHMYVWREVSVDGDIYTLRETRSSSVRGDKVRDETGTNELQDGTLIDLCGATLLWRSREGLARSAGRTELERRLDELNAARPQCPVSLNTLILPRKKPPSKSVQDDRQPYVYLGCGHVQGKHDWGHQQKTVRDRGTESSFKCPICMTQSEHISQLIMGMESAFHLDSASLDYAFNPCGHVASLATVSYWSRIALPHGTNSFHPVCPFCTCLIAADKPYIRLIFQDHCYE